MKRIFNLFFLTQPEQRLIIVLILVLVAGAWLKHHRDLQNTERPTPQGSALSTPPTN
ncbi:MAG TPA: hypothetical protein VH188_04125 [Chthoniobacterales bacterium]|jgi:hypothetical protein|nr:hypothetical protein [Chthoniobacterales bacterium]